MNLPKLIRVGWRNYTVEDWHPVAASREKRYGEIDPAARIIRVSRHWGGDQTAETFMHEVFHALWDERGLSGKVCEEVAVSELSHALCAFARDNHDVFAAWLDHMKLGFGDTK